MTEPTTTSEGEAAKREPQTAVAPLDAIAPEDLQASANEFDKWLQDKTGGYITLDRLTAVIGSLPVLGNIMALASAVMDVVHIVEGYISKKGADFFQWVSLGINVIGIVPTLGAVRMSLRPALHLVRSRFSAGAKDIGAAVVEVLAMDLADHISGKMESFITQAIQKLDEMLKECADWADKFADALISVLKRALGNEPLFKLNPPPPPPASAVYDAKTNTFFGNLMQSAKNLGSKAKHAAQVGATHYTNAYKQVGNYVGSAAASLLPDTARASVQGLIDTLQQTKIGFRASLTKLADPSAERSIMWLLHSIVAAVAHRKSTRHAMMGDKGTQVKQEIHGQKIEAVNKQAPAKGDPSRCKSCPSPTGTGGSISYATGAESFTHTDFVLAAPLPIEWSRAYRSNLAAYDEGTMGARWLTPYTARIDMQGTGRQRELVYHAADGRSHRYPWLEVGQDHRDPIEEITLKRVSTTRLQLDFGKPLPEGEPSPWRETFELVNTCAAKAAAWGVQHFRLAGIESLHGAKLVLGYDHHISDGPLQGAQLLSHVASLQGDQVVAAVAVTFDTATGCISGVWEVREGELERQLAVYEYDDQGDLVRARDENGAAWNYQYRHHLVTRYTDRTNRGMNLEYDGTGPDAKAVHEWADDGSYDTRLEWDENIRLTYVTDAQGGETWVYYDILGYTYRVIHADKREEWFYRDKHQNLQTHVHPDGTTDHYQHDEHGNVIRHIRPDGSRVHYEYDTAHRVVGVLDADSNVWKRDYDQRGRLTEETDPLGHTTEFGYDEAGRVTKVTDAKGGTKKLSYDAQGRLTRYTDCSGRTTQWAYDERGRLAKTTDAAGHKTTYRYTPLTEQTLRRAWNHADYGNHPGQLEAVIHPDKTEEHFWHDAEGRLLKHSDALNRITSYRYTAAGLVNDRIDAAGQRLAYRWDTLGRLVELRNENDRPYSFKYDPVGRLLEETGFDGKTTEYVYADDTGVLQAVKDGGVTTELKFDAMGRLLQRKATAPGRDEQVESFGYYPGGRIGEARNEHARLLWFYDAAGNLVREHHEYQGPLFPDKKTAVWRHRYNELGQRIGTTRPDGHTLEWLTYGSGHLHGLVLDGQDVLNFERDALHREVYRSQGNGLAQHQRYDAMGRLTEQVLAGASYRPPEDTAPLMEQAPFRTRRAIQPHLVHGKVQHSPQNVLPGEPAAVLRRYHYDAAGQLDHIGDSRRGTLSYRYDPVGRLLQATSKLGHEVFAFDPAGNIVPAQEDGEKAPALTEPKLPKVLDNLLKEYTGTTYSYDERGNLTERVRYGQRSAFEWDAFNRMTKATAPEATTTFAYDPLGRRIAKRSEKVNPEGGEKLREAVIFGWDGDTLAFESRTPNGDRWSHEQTVHYIHEPGGFTPLLQATRSSVIDLPATTDTQAIKAVNYGRYDMELDPLWNGELDDREVMPFTQQEIAYYQCDHLGTPQELTDHEGRIAWAAEYKAWGQAKEAISGAARKAGIRNPIRFQGQYADEETGLHYNRYRYYDPHSGRFLSRDPIKLWGGLHAYQYASNPTGWVDALGLARQKGITPNNKGTKTTIEGGSLSEPAVGYSERAGGAGASHPVVKDLYEDVPPDLRSTTHGLCGEPDALSNVARQHKVENADELKALVQGGKSTTVRNDGKLLSFCKSCAHVMKRLNVCDGAGS